VLTEAEEREFLGEGDWIETLEVPCRLERLPQVLAGEEWKAYLGEMRPDVVVGAWKAPRLPTVRDGRPPVPYYCHVTGSVRHVVSAEHLQAGMLVTNWGTSLSRYIAEMALALVLAASRNLGYHQKKLHQDHGWRDGFGNRMETSLFDKRVGLHGCGAIARELSALLAPFRTRTMVWDPYVSEETLPGLGVESADSLEDLFTSSDILVECCALTPETKGIVDEAMLRRLPSGAVFVNIARGHLVDEEALIRLLKEGHLRAGLDVFQHEPLPKDSPLRGLENVMLTPHIGGNTVESRRAAGAFALENLRRFARGEELLGRITLEQYLRMT
jgi:phosphoglycerate dehydrogenase-like enzyme